MRAIGITEAKTRSGLRLVSRPGVPTPWAEAAKAIFHVKGLEFARVHEGPDERGAQLEWTGEAGAPVVAYDNEPVRTGWDEILWLAERLSSDPSLLPREATARVQVLGLAHEICGELGLGWSLRLMMIDRSINQAGEPGVFPVKIANYLAGKYGYRPDSIALARARVRDVLASLAEHLADRRYIVGASLTAVDLYWAAFGNMFGLLTPDELPAADMVRNAWRGVGDLMIGDVPETLRAHHRYVYETYLELPVVLY